MNVVVCRRGGWYGKAVSLDVLCNGKRVASLKENEEVLLKLEASDLPASLEVKMQGVVGSPSLVVDKLGSAMHLECGANIWTLFDFMDLALLSGLRDKVFYLQTVRNA